MKNMIYIGPEESFDFVKSILPNFNVLLANSKDRVCERLPSSDVILDASMNVPFDREMIKRAEVLKLFVTATTGASHIDVDSLRERNIPLLTLAGQKEVLKDVTAAAEHTWLLLLACARQLKPAIQSVLGGEWERSRFPGLMLRGRTLGLVGCGRIGQWMARYASAFGMKILGFDPHLSEWPPEIQRCELEQVMAQSDILSVNMTYSKENENFLDRTRLAHLKHGAILINTSRGELVDETALLDALNEGRIAAAGLDVLRGEPNISGHPLVEYARNHDNLVLTPHIGGFCRDATTHVLRFSCQRIAEFFR